MVSRDGDWQRAERRADPFTTGLLFPIGSIVNRKQLIDFFCGFVTLLDANDAYVSLDFVGQFVLMLEIFTSLPQFFALAR
jgi:hypothetical protein